MTELTIRRVRFWYGIFLSVFTVAIGITFLAEVADLYFGQGIYNEQTGVWMKFTRELVGQRLMHVLVPFCFWIAAVIAGFVLSVVFPIAEKRRRKPDAEKSLARLRSRIPQGEGDAFENNLAKVKKADRIRLILWCVCAAVCIACAVVSLVYIFDQTHFRTGPVNESALSMAKVVLPCVAAAFLCCIGVAVYERIAAKKELPVVKQLVAAGGAPAAKRENALIAFCAKNEKYIILGVRIAVLVLGVTFLLLGIFNGGVNDVLIKAVKICTECIGLG
ncbi:MAG: hypothetical protein K2H43_01320 [Clostridia bacterium]|nr:hypothetical protein [Clostridia bacterium]